MNYKLKLLNRIKIYPIFYILLLELVNLRILVFIKTLSEFIQHNKYKVKRIIDYNSRIQ